MDRYKGVNRKSAINAYLDLINKLKENNHELKSDYTKGTKKVLIDFKCGHNPHWITPNDYRRGRGCPKCAGKSKEYAKEKLLKKVSEQGHELLSNYVDEKTKVLIDFNCGHNPNWITPNSYKHGVGCPVCGGRNKETAYNEFVSMVKDNGHELKSKYINAKTKVLIDFNCGHEPSWITPDSYKRGTGCGLCGCNDIDYGLTTLNRLLKENNHTLKSKYINAKTKVLIDFNCGHEPRWVSPNHYKRGIGCSKCSGRSVEYAKETLDMLIEKNNHILLTPYRKKTEKVLIDFNCGHEPHWITPDNYKRGYGCPKCNLSKGEKEISEILNKMEINYKVQHSFSGLLNKKRLKFDFYIPQKNICIEYDGEQHFKPINFGGISKEEAEKNFEECKKRDILKDEYCQKNNIKLIRIPYWEFDSIESILIKELA